MRNGILILDIISVLPFWLVELVDVSNAEVGGGGGGGKVMKGDKRHMCVVVVAVK